MSAGTGITGQSAGAAKSARPPAADAPRRRGGWRELARGAVAPVACAVVLLGVLAGWVAAGGAGTISRIRITVTQVSLEMPNAAPGTPDRAVTFLQVHNLGPADQLVSARAPRPARVLLVRHHGSQAGPGALLASLPIPAHRTLALDPFGDDLIVVGLPHLMVGQSVPLILRFRHAGRMTVQATVTAPGAP